MDNPNKKKLDGKRKSKQPHELAYDKAHPNNKKTQTSTKKVGSKTKKVSKRNLKK